MRHFWWRWEKGKGSGRRGEIPEIQLRRAESCRDSKGIRVCADYRKGCRSRGGIRFGCGNCGGDDSIIGVDDNAVGEMFDDDARLSMERWWLKFQMGIRHQGVA